MPTNSLNSHDTGNSWQPQLSDSAKNELKQYRIYDYITNIYKNHLMFNSANKRLSSIIKDLEKNSFSLKEGYNKLLYVKHEYEYILKQHSSFLTIYNELASNLEQANIFTQIINLITGKNEEIILIPTQLSYSIDHINEKSEHAQFEESLHIFKKLATDLAIKPEVKASKTVSNLISIFEKSFLNIDKVGAQIIKKQDEGILKIIDNLMSQLDKTLLYFDWKKCNDILHDDFCGEKASNPLDKEDYIKIITKYNQDIAMSNWINKVNSYNENPFYDQFMCIPSLQSEISEEFQQGFLSILEHYNPRSAGFNVYINSISKKQPDTERKIEVRKSLAEIEKLFLLQRDLFTIKVLNKKLNLITPNKGINDIIDALLTDQATENDLYTNLELRKFVVNTQLTFDLADIHTTFDLPGINRHISLSSAQQFISKLEHDLQELNNSLAKLKCYTESESTNIYAIIDKCRTEHNDNHVHLFDQAISIQLGEIINNYHDEL